MEIISVILCDKSFEEANFAWGILTLFFLLSGHYKLNYNITEKTLLKTNQNFMVRFKSTLGTKTIT